MHLPLQAICTEAGLMALRERRMRVNGDDFRKSKENVLYRKNEGTPQGKFKCKERTGGWGLYFPFPSSLSYIYIYVHLASLSLSFTRFLSLIHPHTQSFSPNDHPYYFSRSILVRQRRQHTILYLLIFSTVLLLPRPSYCRLN